MLTALRVPGRTGRGPRPGAAAAPAAGAEAAPPNPLYRLRLGQLWAAMRRQPASFWLVCIYLFFEYVRPQQIYESLAVMPWGNITIIAAVIAVLTEGRRIRMEMPELLLLLFTAVLLLSSVTALQPDIAFDAFGDWLVWLVVYLLIANTVVTETRFLLFMGTYLLWNFKMSQTGVRSWASDGFAFRDWGIAGAPGWFSNSGEFALQMCVFLPVVLGFRAAIHRYWKRWMRLVFWAMALTAVMCIVGSSSRGALVAMAAMTLWMLPKSRYKWRALVGVLVLGAFTAIILPPEQLERLRSSGDDKTSTNRTLYWDRGIDLVQERPVLGIGYKNWPTWHQSQYGFKSMPHNIFIEAAAEMGFLGLGSFVALIVGTLVINARTRRLLRQRGQARGFMYEMAHAFDVALVGYLVGGFFVTVLFYPYFWINLAMTVALNRAARGVEAPAVARRRPAALPPVGQVAAR